MRVLTLVWISSFALAGCVGTSSNQMPYPGVSSTETGQEFAHPGLVEGAQATYRYAFASTDQATEFSLSVEEGPLLLRLDGRSTQTWALKTSTRVHNLYGAGTLENLPVRHAFSTEGLESISALGDGSRVSDGAPSGAPRVLDWLATPNARFVPKSDACIVGIYATLQLGFVVTERSLGESRLNQTIETRENEEGTTETIANLMLSGTHSLGTTVVQLTQSYLPGSLFPAHIDCQFSLQGPFQIRFNTTADLLRSTPGFTPVVTVPHDPQPLATIPAESMPLTNIQSMVTGKNYLVPPLGDAPGLNFSVAFPALDLSVQMEPALAAVRELYVLGFNWYRDAWLLLNEDFTSADPTETAVAWWAMDFAPNNPTDFAGHANSNVYEHELQGASFMEPPAPATVRISLPLEQLDAETFGAVKTLSAVSSHYSSVRTGSDWDQISWDAVLGGQQDPTWTLSDNCKTRGPPTMIQIDARTGYIRHSAYNGPFEGMESDNCSLGTYPTVL